MMIQKPKSKLEKIRPAFKTIPILIWVLIIWQFRFIFTADWTHQVHRFLVNRWWRNYYMPAFIMVSLMCVMVYYPLWCFIFPSYYRKTSNIDIRDGRLYLSTESPLYKILVGEPPKDKIIWYVNRGWLLNVIFPWKSMTKIITDKVFHSREGFQYKVEEPDCRKFKKENGERYIDCTSDKLIKTDVHNEEITEQIQEATEEMTKQIQEASYSNPDIRKEILRHSGYAISPDFKKAVEEAEK